MKKASKRRGRMRKGRRTRRARRVEKQMVPKEVVVAWESAAEMTWREVGAGTERRWKYHWLTVAAVVARWMPAPTANVQR